MSPSVSPVAQIEVLSTNGFHEGLWQLRSNGLVRTDADAPAAVFTSAVADGSSQVVARTLSTGLQQGVQVIRVTTPRCEVEVVLSRGGGIGYLAFDGVSVGWRSPVPGPVHPQFVPLYRPDGLGWLAGFDEVLARCGLFNVGGPQFNDRHQLVHPLHGDVAHWPCQSAVVRYLPEAQQWVVETTTEMVLFHFHHLTLQSSVHISSVEPRIQVVDTIINRGGRPADIMLLHHWNFGPPLADGGSRLEIPYQAVAPRNSHAAASVSTWNVLDPPQAGVEETVYFLTPQADNHGQGHALLVPTAESSGLHLTWDLSTMPYLTLWKNPVAEADGYAVGIEPGTCYPNGRDHELTANRLQHLAPGQSLQVQVSVASLPSADALQAARQAIRTLQPTQATAHPLPQAKFGPV